MGAILVVPNQREGWDIKPDGAEMAQTHFAECEQAVAAAERAVEVGEADDFEVRDEVDEVEEPAEQDRGLMTASLWFSAVGFAVFTIIVVFSVLDPAG